MAANLFADLVPEPLKKIGSAIYKGAVDLASGDDPFADLVPSKPEQKSDPFSDLVPASAPAVAAAPTTSKPSFAEGFGAFLKDAAPTPSKIGAAIMDSASSSWEKLKDDFVKSLPDTDKMKSMSFLERMKPQFEGLLATGKLPVDAFNLLISPVTGLQRGLISEPVSKITGGMLKPEQVDEAMMGIAPGKRLGAIPEKPMSTFKPAEEGSFAPPETSNFQPESLRGFSPEPPPIVREPEAPPMPDMEAPPIPAPRPAVGPIPDDLIESAKSKIGGEAPSVLGDEPLLNWKEKAKSRYVDAFHPVKVLAQKEAAATGAVPDLSAYRDLRLLRGVEGAILANQKKGTLGYAANGDVIFTGKPLNEVFQPIANDLPDAQVYFAARRAKELQGRGIKTPFTPQEIQAGIDLGKKPGVEQAFKDYQDYNARMLDFAEQSGLLNAQTKAGLLEAGKDYVPFYRVMDDGAKKGKGSGSPIMSPIKGSERNVEDIFDNINRNSIMWVEASLRNKAKAQAYDMIERLGLADVARRVPSYEKAPLADKRMEQLLSDSGLKDPGETVGIFGRPDLGKNRDVVYRNGKREVWEISDPDLMGAMEAVNPKSLPVLSKVLSIPANVLRRGVTLSPDFMIKNFVRDTQASFAQSGGNFVPFVSSMRGMISRLAKDNNYWEALANGGGFSSVYKGEKALSRDIEKFYGKRGFSKDSILDTPRKIGDKLEEITSALEQASRLEEFRMVSKKSGSMREGALAARDVASDFGGRGASPTFRNISATIPFLNARLQGLNRMVEVGRANPAKIATKGLLAITALSVALYMLNKDNPDYQALPDYVKDLNWVFQNGKGGFYLMPKGFEWGTIFASLPERMIQTAEEENGKAFADFLGRSITSTFAVSPPQAISPLVDLATNQKFTGAPVIPADLEDVRPSEQFRPWTSDSMRELAAAMRAETGIEISPMKAEHLVNGYLGTLGMYALAASDWGVRGANGQVSPTSRLDEMPVTRSFMKLNPAQGSQFQNDFYELMGESRMAAATAKKIQQEGREPDLNKREQKLNDMRGELTSVSRQGTQFNKQQREVTLNPALTAEEKRRLIDDIQTRRNKLFYDYMKSTGSTPEGKAMLRSRGMALPK